MTGSKAKRDWGTFHTPPLVSIQIRDPERLSILYFPRFFPLANRTSASEIVKQSKHAMLRGLCHLGSNRGECTRVSNSTIPNSTDASYFPAGELSRTSSPSGCFFCSCILAQWKVANGTHWSWGNGGS
jgi:hypothetical protein